MVIGAFKQTAAVYQIPPTWLPAQPTVANFQAAWTSAPFGRYYINAIITTLFGSGVVPLARPAIISFGLLIGKSNESRINVVQAGSLHYESCQL